MSSFRVNRATSRPSSRDSPRPGRQEVGDSYLRIHHLVDYVDEWQWDDLKVFTVGDPGAVTGEEYRGGVVTATAKVGFVTQLSCGWDCYTPSH